MELNLYKVSQETVDKLHRRESRQIQAKLRARQLNLEKPFVHNATMVGIPWNVFSKIGSIPRSDQASQFLVDFTPASMEGVFVSHEWWVRSPRQYAPRVTVDGMGKVAFHYVAEQTAQPDYPDGHAQEAHLKYRVVCSGVMELMQRGVLDGSKTPFIWMDYFSVNQIDADDREDALDSMVHYLSMCKAMLIPTQQEDGAIARASCPEELDGYCTRCWCRCECLLFAIASELQAASQRKEGGGGGEGASKEAEEVPLLLFAASRSGALTQLPRTTWGSGTGAAGGSSELELSVEADRVYIAAMEATALDAYGRTHIRRACKLAQKQKVRKVEGGKVALGSLRLCDGHMEAFTTGLSAGHLDAVDQIDLSHNFLTDAAISTLAAALTAHPLRKLEELSLKGNQVTAEGMRTLAGVVGDGCRLL